MFGLTGRLHTANRTRMIGSLAIAAVIMLSIWAPSAAHASGCENSWTNNKGGSWFEAGNWSKKAVPTSSEEVCVTLAGTYTVTMTQTSGTVSLKALTVGGTSGTQTLAVGSSSSVNAILATSAGLAVEAHGALTLTNGDVAANNVTLEGPVTNSGTITSELLHGGARTLFGSLTNKGTLQINTTTAFNASKAVLTNEGAIKIAEAKQLTISNTAAVVNGTGGSVAATGTGDLLASSGTSFTEGAGTTSGTQPVVVDDAALIYTGSGSSLIRAHGAGTTLSGNISSGQTLSIESTVSENAETKAGASFTNAGSIVLTNGDTAANYADLYTTAGTMTNSGTISSEAGVGGARYLEGNVTNTGTININATTKYDTSKALLTNEGAINLAEGVQLIVSNEGAVINGAGGSIAGGTSGTLLAGNGTSFTEGAGTTSGTQPVIVDDATLAYTGSGGSLIRARGASKLSGNIAAGQTLSIESTVSENAETKAGASFTNAGSIVLTNGDTAANYADLYTTAGTLTNSGSISSEVAHGGARYLEGNVTNTGTININLTTKFDISKTLLTNEGTLNIATGAQLLATSSASVTNASGKIAAGTTGGVLQTSGTFTEGAGTTSGAQAVILDDGAIVYTGSGASVIHDHGSSTLSGNIAAGQTLSIESTSSENAETRAGASFSNGGSIVLTNGDSAANYADLYTTTGTLTNSGTISSEAGVGGARYLEGNVTNTGTININATTKYDIPSAALINKGAINIANGVALLVIATPTVSNEGGTIAGSGSGALVQTGGTFNQGLGKTTGSEPVILDDLALQYTGKGASTIALRGSSTLSGPINSGQVLSIQSTSSEHAFVTATLVKGVFTNSGTITLTNSDTAGNNATLNLAGGTLTNKGTINAEEPHGGARTIEGNLNNEKTVSLSAGANLKVTGAYTQSKGGTLKTAIASSSSFGVLSVTSTATIAGALTVVPVNKFKALLGQNYNILTSSSLTGTFAKESGVSISNGLYYKPTYSATGVTLVVSQATLVLSVTSGLPGAIVKLSGKGYLPGDTITPTFTDHAKVKTIFPGVATNGSGEFSTEITIPESAAVGAGSVNVKSTLTGVSISKAFTVT